MPGSPVEALRRSLWPLAPLYGLATALRNRAYDRGRRAVHRLPVPVLSVGNLTVGGTGKTPLVVWLVQAAVRAGLRPGVLARGYGRRPGASCNDEGMLLQGRFPDLLQVQEPDRVAGGSKLVAMGAEVLILDDGFQHRRLHRDVDLLCLDAERPFGDGTLLPAGDLRESTRGLRRADLLVLTRADRLERDALDRRRQRLQEMAGRSVPVYACRHAPGRLRREPGGVDVELAELRGGRVVLLSAIARPESFRRTAESLGAEVVDELRYRDHHHFTKAELGRASARAQRADAWLLVTEKDAVRIDGSDPVRYVLCVDVQFLGDQPSPEELGWVRR